MGKKKDPVRVHKGPFAVHVLVSSEIAPHLYTYKTRIAHDSSSIELGEPCVKKDHVLTQHLPKASRPLEEWHSLL